MEFLNLEKQTDKAGNKILLIRAVHGLVHQETKLGQGRDSVKQMLLDNPELFESTASKIIKNISR